MDIGYWFWLDQWGYMTVLAVFKHHIHKSIEIVFLSPRRSDLPFTMKSASRNDIELEVIYINL